MSLEAVPARCVMFWGRQNIFRALLYIVRVYVYRHFSTIYNINDLPALLSGSSPRAHQ